MRIIRALERIADQANEAEPVDTGPLTEFCVLLLEAGLTLSLGDLASLDYRELVALAAAGRRRRAEFISSLGAASQTFAGAAAALEPVDGGLAADQLFAEEGIAVIRALGKGTS